MQLEGSSLGSSEGGGVVGAQAAPQDPLLSLFTDLGDDAIGYQEAVPSADGVGAEVVVVGEIIGQEAHGVTMGTEGMGTEQMVVSRTEEIAWSDKPADGVITRRPRFQLAAHFDS